MCTLPKPALVFVTPNGYCQDYDKALGQTQDVIAAGASLVQIRDRLATTTEILRLAENLMSVGVKPSNLSINGVHPNDVFRLSPALGVHIREADLPEYSPAARTLQQTHAITGCSVHSVASAKRAMEVLAPTYIQVGTMFSTGSHPGKIPEGPALLRAIRRELGPKQALIGIGGISERNLQTVFENGATGIAVISSIAASHNTHAAASELLQACEENFEEVCSSL